MATSADITIAHVPKPAGLELQAREATPRHTPATADLATGIISFEAPYLEARFIQYGLAENEAAAAELFLELKRYLFLAACAPSSMPMMSALVDAAWHQFILFTEEYRDFCEGVVGSFQHHGPRRTDAGAGEVRLSPATFFEAYREHFGPPPDVWHNERCVRLETRIVHPVGSCFAAEVVGSRVHLLRFRAAQDVVCIASLRARPALEFVANNRVFLVRELPGLKGPGEQLALITPLIEHDILRLAF